MSATKSEKIAFCSNISSNKGAGLSLAEFLAKRFTYFPHDEWVRLIEVGDVLLNQERANPTRILRAGDEVRYMALKRAEPRTPKNISVLFEDEDLLIVNKPPHIPVHPTGRYLRNTLIHVLQDTKKLDFLVLSHRLDRETSGVCVLSKTTLAKDKMYWQFFENTVHKTYWALTWGRPNPPSGVVDAPIGLSHTSKIRIKQEIRGKDSKTAKTKYHTISTKWVESPQWEPPPWPAMVAMLDKKNKGVGWEDAGLTQGPWPISLVECKPVTGRTNQIRVHLAHLGAGVLGDKLYDPEERIFLEVRKLEPVTDDSRAKIKPMTLPPDLLRRLVLDAHALHAKSLEFRHPRTGKVMRVDAPVPKSWHGLY